MRGLGSGKGAALPWVVTLALDARGLSDVSKTKSSRITLSLKSDEEESAAR